MIGERVDSRPLATNWMCALFELKNRIKSFLLVNFYISFYRSFHLTLCWVANDYGEISNDAFRKESTDEIKFHRQGRRWRILNKGATEWLPTDRQTTLSWPICSILVTQSARERDHVVSFNCRGNLHKRARNKINRWWWKKHNFPSCVRKVKR